MDVERAQRMKQSKYGGHRCRLKEGDNGGGHGSVRGEVLGIPVGHRHGSQGQALGHHLLVPGAAMWWDGVSHLVWMLPG